MKRWAEWVFVAAVAIHVWLAVESASTPPPLLDEFAHVSAGVSHWDRGGFSLYREDLPLVRSLNALPVYFSGARMNYQRAVAGAGVNGTLVWTSSGPMAHGSGPCTSGRAWW